VSTPTRTRQWLIALLVCVLALGVFVLASQAKCSQYRSGTHSESYLAKATKMSGNRCQTPAVVAPCVAPPMDTLDAAAHVVAGTPEPLPLQAVFLDSFHVRPPPMA
jgi:hypothetical protein